MKYIKNYLSSSIVHIIIIIILSFTARYIWLDRIPTGITHDEIGFVFTAKSLYLTGSDVSGKWSPFTLSPVTGEFPQAELPQVIIAPIIGPLPFSLINAKLPYVLINTLFVLIVFLISKKLFGKYEALIIGLVAAFNPWNIFFARTAYEAPIALFFYFLAFYLLLILKKWKILVAFIPLFLGFYSYMGAKLIFIPFVFIVSFYSWFVINHKKYTKQYILLFTLSVLLIVFFIFSLQNQSTQSRLSELATPQDSVYTQIVDEERRLSMETPLSQVLSNKLVVYTKDLIGKYLRVFSTDLMFLSGEGRSTFSLWYHGYFYYTDIIFLLIGFCVMFMHKRKEWMLLVSLIIIAPIPTVLSNVTTGFAALRSVLIFPLFMMLIGYGIWYLILTFKKTSHLVLIVFFIIIVYTLQITNFSYIYFLRNPIYNSEAYSFSTRVLSKYLSLASDDNKHATVITSDPKGLFKQYIFYSDFYNTESASTIQELFNSKNYNISTITFRECSEPEKFAENEIVIGDTSTTCGGIIFANLENTASISQLSDGGVVFKIVNDKVCNDIKLEQYPHNLRLSDFSTEKISKERFCEKFITRL